MADTGDLLVAEYNAHQARYRQLADQAVWLQNYALIYAAAIWTWALAAENAFISALALWLPLLITILFALKALFLHRVAKNIFLRLAEIEGYLNAGDQGWYVRMIEEKPLDEALVRPLEFFWRWTIYFWGGLLALNIVLSGFGTLYLSHISAAG